MALLMRVSDWVSIVVYDRIGFSLTVVGMVGQPGATPHIVWELEAPQSQPARPVHRILGDSVTLGKLWSNCHWSSRSGSCRHTSPFSEATWKRKIHCRLRHSHLSNACDILAPPNVKISIGAWD